jgi:Holliday junction resolvase-like predicted endonuclease
MLPAFATGKTKLIATTNGFINFVEVKVSVNAAIPMD